MFRVYAIMREPGPAAIRRAGLGATPRPKRVATVTASGQMEALGDFVHDRYLASGNQQYAGRRFEWRSSRALRFMEWRPNDGADPGTRGREWSLVVMLRNGDVEHEARFLAWASS